MTLQKHSSAFKDAIFRLQCEEGVVLNLTQKDIDVLLSGEFQAFIEGLEIVTKNEGRKPLIWNPAQEQIWHWLQEKREAKKKARGICCKSRREGVSTQLMAIGFADVIMRPNRYAYMASHEAESAEFIFGMNKIYYDSLSPDWKKRRPLKTITYRKIQCAAPHNSMFTAATANKKSLASSQLIHHLHLSEPAKYKNPPANDAITSILQCVPNHWDTLVFWESTAFGAHNIFHQWYMDAKAGKNDYDALFLSWKNFPEYFFYFTGDVDVPESATVIDKPAFNQEELEYQDKWDVCDRQMAWASDMRRNSCHGDWNEFNQEYPIHDSVAFKFSGYRWFDAEALEAIANRNHCSSCDRWQNSATPWNTFSACDKSGFVPIARGYLKWDSDDRPLVGWVDDPNGTVLIWRHPEKGRQYVGFGDIAEGVGGDWTVINIVSIPDEFEEFLEVVAQLRSNRLNAHQAGIQGFQLGTYYNRAFIGIESNEMGGQTCQVMERGGGYPQMKGGYPNLYYDVRIDRRTQQETQKIGFRTTAQSKPNMLGHLQSVIKEGNILIHSPNTLMELEGFCWDVDKGDWVQSYVNEQTRLAHDDEVIALAGSLQMVVHYQSRVSMATPVDGAL